MIEMTYNQVSSFDFLRTIQKVAAIPTNPKTAYKIKKLVDAIQRQKKIISGEYQKEIVDTYALKDEKGELVKPKEGPHEFEVIPEKREEFQTAQNDFSTRTFKIDRTPLTIDELGDMKITAAEINNLGPILADAEETAPTETGKVLPMR